MKIVQPNIFLYFFLILIAISGIVFPVLWPQANGFYAFIVILSIGGLGVASYIRYTKSRGEELVCPVGSNCNVVVNSQYSKFLGVSLEYWGMLYYSILLLSYIYLIFIPHIFTSLMLLGLSLLTTSAFLFSLYLLFIQAFILRQWCIWCLLSAIFSIIIFITSLASLNFVIEFLSGFINLIDFIHTLGFGLGIGGVTVVLFLFSKFLKDNNINFTELYVLKSISEIILTGLVLVLVSQFLLFIIDPQTLSDSPFFLIQTISLVVAGFSGAVLMVIFNPLLEMIPFGEDDKLQNKSPFSRLEKPFFVIAAISLSSWYFSFASRYITDLSFFGLLFLYAIVLLVATLMAFVLERRIEE
jgi:uncharacterized membrane protein